MGRELQRLPAKTAKEKNWNFKIHFKSNSEIKKRPGYISRLSPIKQKSRENRTETFKEKNNNQNIKHCIIIQEVKSIFTYCISINKDIQTEICLQTQRNRDRERESGQTGCFIPLHKQNQMNEPPATQC